MRSEEWTILTWRHIAFGGWLLRTRYRILRFYKSRKL